MCACVRAHLGEFVRLLVWVRVRGERGGVSERARVQSYLPSMQGTCAILYYNLWPSCFQHIFLHYFIKGMILEKKKVLIFSTTFN
jgi:hypothetical protein